jgi:uncharacterized membrane protein
MKKQRPEIFFSILILVLGMVLLLITPAGANFDEETYVARIWEMGLGHVMPNSYLSEPERLPSGFYNISYRRQINLPAIDLDTLKRQMKIKIDGNDLMTYQTRAVYFPTLFAVQAVVMRFFGPHLDLPILVLYYLLRLSYLLIYCFLVYLTIRILPFGKWVFGAITIAPMCLIQAGSVSSDAMIFGIAFLFIAWILRLVSNPNEALTKKELLITCLLILAVGTLKPNTIFLLALLIFIPIQRLKHCKAWLIILCAVVVSVAISVGWSYVASQYFMSRDDSGIDSIAQILSFFTNPQIFLKNFWITLSNSLPVFYKQAVGVAGYGYWNMPKIIYWMFPITLVLALLSERIKVNLTVKQRVVFGLVGLFNLLLVFAIFFVVETPLGYAGIRGIQGRYFTPFLPLLLIPFMFTPKFKISQLIIGIVLTVTSIICVVSLFMSYHVVCGYALMTNQPCVLPYYKNWDPSTFEGVTLDKKSSIKQSMVITCRQLDGIQVWVKENQSTAGQEAFFALEMESGELIQSSWIQSDEMPQSGWATIQLDPPVNSLNQALQFEILAKDGIGIPGLALGVFPTNEFNRGLIVLNGKELDQDLVFKYSCADDFSTLLK